MISIYIHIPFCKRKCSYCDFYSISNLSKIDDYIDALTYEIILYSREIHDKFVQSIFIGGGTPSLLNRTNIEKIFNAIKNNFNLEYCTEISVEANPESISLEFLNSCYEFGVNRVSIGVQSLDNEVLNRIGRLHDKDTAISAISMAQSIGFKNINVDIMYGLPNQSSDKLLDTLNTILSFNISHISAYNLIVEDNTAIKKSLDNGKISIPDEDEQVSMYHLCKKTIEQKGIMQYEISNYAIPGHECIHNMRYWEHKEYLGIGAASHSFIKRNNKYYRYYNVSNIEKYIANVKNKDLFLNSEKLSVSDLKLERIMLGFRLVNGFSIKKYNDDFNSDFLSEYEKQIDTLYKENLLTIKGDNIMLSDRGLELENAVILKFIN